MNNNEYITIAAADQSRTDHDFPEHTNYWGRGVVLSVGAESVPTGTITVKIQGKDLAAEKYYDILTSAAIAASGFTVLKVYPGIAVTSNISANDVLPQTWRVSVVSPSGAIYSLGASIIA